MNWITLGQQVFFGISNGMAYALFALGLSMIWGSIGVINVAHGEFYMLGAMIAWTFGTLLKWNFLASVLLSMAIVGGIAILSNYIVIRPLLASQNFVLATFLSTIGLGMIIVNGAMVIWNDFPRQLVVPFSSIMTVAGIKVSFERILAISTSLGAVFLLQLFITRTSLGRAIRATSQNIIGAKLVGIDPRRTYMVAFTLAGGFAALAGILLAPIWYAYPYMGQFIMLKGFVIVIMAGLGSILGSVVVGVFIGLIEALFGQYISVNYSECFLFICMIIIMIVKPSGLFIKTR